MLCLHTPSWSGVTEQFCLMYETKYRLNIIDPKLQCFMCQADGLEDWDAGMFQHWGRRGSAGAVFAKEVSKTYSSEIRTLSARKLYLYQRETRAALLGRMQISKKPASSWDLSYTNDFHLYHFCLWVCRSLPSGLQGAELWTRASGFKS